jgi:hypothetical protein
MKIQQVLIALTVINLGLLLFVLSRVIPPVTAATPPVLRGSALQIVDDQGRVRASIGIQPPSTAANGEEFTETVLLRLIDPAGQPSVKIAASVTGAGLSFVGGDDKSYIILQAEGAESTLKMVEPEGRERVIGP